MTRLERTFSKGREILWRFASDRRGNIAIVFGFVLIPLVGMVGLAVDGLRAYNAAEAAHKAADASALAAARAMSEQDLDQSGVTKVAQDYFDANARGTGKMADTVFDSLIVEPDFGANSVTVTVNARIPTTFAAIFDVQEIELKRSSTVAAGLNDIDLGLMLDVTGSMRQRGKLQAMKNATNDLIDMLIPNGRQQGRVRIALAPYSEQVNVGRFARRVSDAENRTGCVAERSGPHRNTDIAPFGANRFHVLTEEDRENHLGRGICPPAEIEPLSSNGAQLKRIVRSYQANGYTAGHLGIQWAWNLISPEWNGIWPGGSTPHAYDRKGVIKAVVLMTDGEFNTAYTVGGSRRGAEQAMKRESYRNTGELCANIKKEDVIVFSVAFDLNDRDAQRALEDCSSGEGFFHRAENEEQLRAAYRKIALKLTDLRIAK